MAAGILKRLQREFVRNLVLKRDGSVRSAFQQWTRVMYKRIYSRLRGLKSNTTDETNGRHIVPYLVVELCGANESPSILDVGAGYGKDLLAVKREVPEATMSAVEG